MIDANGEAIMDNPEWYAVAEFSDGDCIEFTRPYLERGIWTAENRRQHELEEELLYEANEHAKAVNVQVLYYSVGVREHVED